MERERIVVYADPDLADEIPWYLGQIREYIASIGRALEQGDYETIQDTGHRMKGSGKTFGFDTVSEIGKSIEIAAKEKDPEEIKKQVLDLSDYLDRVAVVYEEPKS